MKCYRQRNCANCVDTGVACQRFRPGRASKKLSTRYSTHFSYYQPNEAEVFLGGMSRGEHLDFQESLPSGGANRENLGAGIPQSPPAELLYMLLPEPVICDGLFSRIRWPDHISDRALERMMASLLDNECGEQLFHQKSTNPSVKQLHKTKRTYEAAALRALKHINLMSTPSLLLLQALISALTNSQGGYSDEIQSAVCWCFYLDRTTSALLMRSFSLLEVNAPPTHFMTNDTSSSYDSLLLRLLDLAKVQGSLLGTSLSDEDKSKSRIFEIFQGIQEQRDRIYSNLQENQRSLSDPAVFEWRAADFYYSIYVDMLRTRLGYDASQTNHVDCLLYSRRALRAFLFLQENVDHMPGFNDPEPPFLTWFASLALLERRIIKGLSQFKSSPFLTRLLNLLTSLLELCDPLFQNTIDQTRQSDMEGEDHTSIDVPLTHNLNNTANDPSLDLEYDLDQPTSSNSMNMGVEPCGHGVGDPAPYPLADDLMWQFVNSQFPYSWLESGIIVDTM
ncbi:hypothetical protein BDV23DRAFT_193791 [Aspergillus alliaceus]|uniref:Zn(2)-C6 fungal-type domain-containing protein n=1 Tax=Petromyces alliaceus TaxID=209559 RepID=A0A5N7C9Y6_PETAA|nr:hypothetical protein BDV23DRAFT_193791 [Aspergillus alliaceus]